MTTIFLTGRGDLGVCLTRYFDVEVNYFLQSGPAVDIFVFKVRVLFILSQYSIRTFIGQRNK